MQVMIYSSATRYIWALAGWITHMSDDDCDEDDDDNDDDVWGVFIVQTETFITWTSFMQGTSDVKQ